MKFRKRDAYILIAMVNVIWFAIAVLYINYQGNDVSPELVQWWFLTWVVEFLTIGGVTISKELGNKRTEMGLEDEDLH